jgi:GT2 family glycosyltransferase
MSQRKPGDLAVVWIHYQTPELLIESVTAMQEEARAHGMDVELVIVDNGGLSEWTGHGALATSRVVVNDSNKGYSGGVNTGVLATDAENIVVMNPDVVVLPGCLARLREALHSFAIVGPALFLDRKLRFRLPPTEQRDFVSALLGEVAHGSPLWAARARKRWRKHVSGAHGNGSSTVPGADLSGAMLAFSRRAWDALGPWDEQYRLYFEETDWLSRASSRRLPTAYVGHAHCVHLYAQSTRKSPHSDRWFAQSARRFERQHYRLWQRLMLQVSRKWARSRSWEPDEVVCRERTGIPAWVELSGTPRGYPAARARVESPVEIDKTPEWVPWNQLPSGRYWLRRVDADDNDLSVVEVGRID